jgi:hypothetical protein
MRHSPDASAATTAPGGTVMPPVRLQGAQRGRSRPRSRQAADRSVHAPRPPVLRPSPTRIEGRRCMLQASLWFGSRAAARPAVCEAPLYPFEHPRWAKRGPHHCPAVRVLRSRAAERLRGSFRAPQRPQPQRPERRRYRLAHLWPLAHSGTNIERTSANECNRSVNKSV